MRAAAIQLNSTANKDRNVATAERLVREAAADGAGLIVLPEKWNVLGDGETLRDGAEPLDGPSLTATRSWARELGAWIVAGSIAERIEGRDKLANTSALVDREGAIVATYRKIHLFDVVVDGVTYSESDHEDPGDEAVVTAAAGIPLGLTICYDLRFPELYRSLALAGARVITVPSAFTAPTGRAHWEVLLRARAIEDQVFVVAANQVGKSRPDHESWGHSMVVDPWGVVLAEAPDGECFVAADLDFAAQDEVRDRLPSLRHVRHDASRVAQGAGA